MSHLRQTYEGDPGCPPTSLTLSARPTASVTEASIEARVEDVATSSPPTPGGVEPPAVPEAVRLFVERARAVVPGFTLTDRNAAAVEEICRRLDGIPLAIELAAARIEVLSPEQIAARLGDRFRLLSCGSRTALPRHQTLLALVDWSHDLLDERERVLLRRLAVFSGGWTLEAAESVCAGESLGPAEVLDVLARLVAKTHHTLGLAAYFEGDLVEARQHYQATLALYEGLGDQLGIASALNDLGELAFQRGELDEAQALESSCLAMARRIDDTSLIAMALAVLAGISVARGRPTRGLRLAAAATALNDATGQRRSPAWHAMLDRWLAPARRAMSAEASAAAEAAGRAMRLGEAIQEALGSDRSAGAAPTPSPSPAPVPAPGRRAANPPEPPADRRPPPVTFGLTLREQEVAALVARGLTNRQIAAELVIATGTATNHVKHILARLGLDSRAQIAAWAVEHGLVGRAAP